MIHTVQPSSQLTGQIKVFEWTIGLSFSPGTENLLMAKAHPVNLYLASAATVSAIMIMAGGKLWARRGHSVLVSIPIRWQIYFYYPCENNSGMVTVMNTVYCI